MNWIEEEQRKKKRSVAEISLYIGLFLAVIKTLFGLIFFNLTMLVDAASSGFDLASSGVVVGSTYVKDKKKQRVTEIISISLIGILMITTAIIFIFVGRWELQRARYIGWVPPMLLVVAVISIIIKEIQYQYVRYHARKIQSRIMHADAISNRLDAFASIFVLIGYIMTMTTTRTRYEAIMIFVVSGIILIGGLGMLIKAGSSLRYKNMLDKKEKVQIFEDEF
ncbi:MAG: cation transporter [Firmicutes bacterium]|nr:cation transporter [Bacillota bacterium]